MGFNSYSGTEVCHLYRVSTRSVASRVSNIFPHAIKRYRTAVAMCMLTGFIEFHSPVVFAQEVVSSSVLETPSLTSNVTGVDFENIYVGQSTSKQFVLTNSALDDENIIRIEAVYLNEIDERLFKTNFIGPVVLKGGASHAINVSFKPSTVGQTIGTLFVTHTGKSGIEIFTLDGTAIGNSAEQKNQKMSDLQVIPFEIRAKAAIGFGKSQLSGIGSIKPTSLQFGPDDKLYVSDMRGVIKVYTVSRAGANNYDVQSTETINLVRDIPNHNDNGQPNNSIVNRLVTGFTVVGTASNPIIFVASSDPRFGGGASFSDTNLDTNSGVISRLTKQNGQWQKLDLVRGLSRSEENHSVNGLHFDAASNLLYVSAGGNTNQGATSNNFALLPEYALSAAILSIDLTAIGNNTYDLPTLNDQTRAGVADANDPFGGNNGLNQAKLVPGGPVQVYAPGFRNAYDIEVTRNGYMYTIDNGPNGGWGGIPVNEGSAGVCTNGIKEPGSTFFDGLHLITGQGYYGGHANPTRGNSGNTFNTSNPQSPVTASNPIECDYKGTGANGSLISFGTSVNGLIEYRASNLGNQLNGDLLAAAFDNKIYRLHLNDAGTSVVSKTALFSNVGTIPLDVTALADDELFPGTIWVAEFVEQKVYVFEPSDYTNSGSTNGNECENLQAGGDQDGDGFTNGDESANNTNPCSAADVPSDIDGDFVSDLIDDDDDNDNLADLDDPFALDASNGRGTSIPLSYNWENNSTPAGYLFNLGFSGLMNNGSTDYLNQFNLDQLTAGGAAGVFTIDHIPAGDPINGLNTQKYGFQFGVDVTPSTPEFTVHTRILSPFSGLTPQPNQSMGFYIGTGDQDNYIKFVVNAAGADGGLQFGAERNGVYEWVKSVALPITDAVSIDLLLTVDPGTQTVTASYQINHGGSSEPVVELSPSTAFPLSWLTSQTGLAVGIISTSNGASSFTATWDFIDLYYVDGATDGTTAGTIEGCPASIALGDLGYGIATRDNAVGSGWILWSKQSVFSRFSPSPFSQSAQHLVAVTHVDGQWFYDNNGGLFEFQPNESDCLVASINFTTDTVTLLKGSKSIVQGIYAGYASGDLSIVANRWANVFNAGEFGVDGTSIIQSSNDITTPDPVTTDPVATDPVTADPVTADPVTADPVTADPVTTDPVTTDPVTTDPVGPGTATSCPANIDLGDLGYGIAARDSATGSGWILWSEQNIFSRLNPSPFSQNAQHLIAVTHVSDQWFYDNNGVLIEFQPNESDCLVASVNFTTDTVTLLEGSKTVVEGIDAGYASGNLSIIANRWANVFNAGEFGLDGTSILQSNNDETSTDPLTTDPVSTDPVTADPVTTDPVTTDPVTADPVITDPVTTDPVISEPVTTEVGAACPVTLNLGPLGYGVAADDQATGEGWIMWSEESLFSRFQPAPIPGNAKHLIAVKYVNGKWLYDYNGGLTEFEPRLNDCLLALVNFGTDSVSMLQGNNGLINAIDSGYVSGNLQITANRWAGWANIGEFGVSGTQIITSQD
jgi:hypothetical protein